jgi:DNA polymerase-3 subunit alpha
MTYPYRHLFFDTETTGLPKNRNSNGLESKDNWPDIVSISWAVYELGVRKFIKYAIIKPEDWTIPEDSIKIHGITNEIANEKGEWLEDVLAELTEDLVMCDSVVAHNLEFDKNVLFAAYKWRLNQNPWPFWPKDEICTMNRSERELEIPSKYPKASRPFKSPSLKELYEATFSEPVPAGTHNSRQDVEILTKIYWKRWP